MATVFARTYAKKLWFKPEQRAAVGVLICAAFYSQTAIPHIVYKKKQKEGKETFVVLDYPPKFTPEMDRIIQEYADRHKIPPYYPAKKKLKKRNRKPVSRPVGPQKVYSTRTKK